MPEETLDPQNWREFATLAHRMVDEMLHHLETLRDRPAWQEMPQDLKRRLLDEPVPMEPQGEAETYEQFKADVLPYPVGNLDPRFFGWVQGNGIPLGMMADMLASGLNPHVSGFNQAPALVETKVIEWLRQLFDFPEGASGLLVSGGSMASFTGLAVARNAMAGYDVRKAGLKGGPQLTVYGSTETHSWAKKAMEVLGLGSRAYKQIPVHKDFTMDLEALRTAVAADRKQGMRPIAVLATAGTVNTGASDDLEAIADFCQEEGLWMHVDGAFGALAYLSPKLKPAVKGLERADSLAFDLHKWMYLNFECACVLVRDGEHHRAAFDQNASYIAGMERGVIAGGLYLADLGLELTRSFKALKAWMSLKAYGVDKFVRVIEQNVDQAQYLAELVRAEPKLQLTAEVPLNIVCFRYVADLPGPRLNALNTEILLRLQEDGIAIPSSTQLGKKFCIRACIVNHRTRREDLDALVAGAVRLGDELVEEFRA